MIELLQYDWCSHDDSKHRETDQGLYCDGCGEHIKVKWGEERDDGAMENTMERDAEEIGTCEWCGGNAYQPVGYGPYGEPYCCDTCAENIDREVDRNA